VNKPAASLAIFRAGTHTSVDGRTLTFSEDVIRELAESYDPELHEAPLVVGHPKLDAPAYGWAKSLRAENGVLYAEPHQVEPEFAELVNAGRFKKISSSIYLPDSPGNPKPGKHYIKHIGFLGAAAPAVKGLRTAQFAAGDGAVEFAGPMNGVRFALVDLFQRLRDHFVEREGADAADKIIPQWQIRSIDELLTDRDSVPARYAEPQALETEMSQTPQQQDAAGFAEREQQIKSREAELAAREQALKEREAKARRDDVVAFADEMVQQGKLLPRERDAIVEVLLAMPADTSVSFAEGGQQVTLPMSDVLRNFIVALPKRVDFAEKSRDDGAPDAVSFAAPSGYALDPARAALHAKAIAYQREHPNTDYLTAVRLVGG
jgi:hypothetical protein